jgi:hypothetical protein
MRQLWDSSGTIQEVSRNERNHQNHGDYRKRGVALGGGQYRAR